MNKFMKVALITLGVILGLWGVLVLASKAAATRHEQKAFVKSLQKFTVSGHRGASVEFAPNTLEAFRRLKEIDPAAMIELDVWQTKDGIPVVFHDENLEASSSGKGRMIDHTLAEVRTFEAGYNVTLDGGKTYPFRGKGHRIPTLEEVLKEFPDSIISIDIKYPLSSFADIVMAMVRQQGMLDKVVIGSFSDAILDFVNAKYPTVALTFGSADAKRFLFLNWFCLSGFFRTRADVIMVPQFSDTDRPEYLGEGTSQGFRILTKSFIDSARRLGFPVFAWTNNRKENMKDLIDIGIDGIITDDPAALKEVMAGGKDN